MVTKIAGIYGSHLYPDCRHIWSPKKLLLQAYLIPTLIDIAGIIGLPLYDMFDHTFGLLAACTFEPTLSLSYNLLSPAANRSKQIID